MDNNDPPPLSIYDFCNQSSIFVIRGPFFLSFFFFLILFSFFSSLLSFCCKIYDKINKTVSVFDLKKKWLKPI